MGNFDFDCCNCDKKRTDDEYIDMRVRITVILKNKKTIVLEGIYDGYGSVEVVGINQFWAKQFSEQFELWTSYNSDYNRAFLAEHIYCRECLDCVNVTPRIEYSKEDFVNAITAKEPRAQAPVTVIPVLPASKPASKMLKSELVKELEELRTEVIQLRKYKTEFVELEKET